MKYSFRFFSVLLVLACVISANAKNGIESMFSFETETLAGFNMNYRKVERKIEGDTCMTVVIYLHGGSGQGDDNQAQMESPAIADIYKYLLESGRQFTLLVPQVPYGQQWMGLAVPAVKTLADKYAADSSGGVYILGGSMGGNGVWNMLSAYPGYFVGAMPVACNTPRSKPALFKMTRIVSVIGGNDRKRDFGKIKSFFERLNQQGGYGEVDVENSWGHRQTCEWSFTPERLDRLFNQQR